MWYVVRMVRWYQKTLPSRHNTYYRIRNMSHGGLSLITLPLGYGCFPPSLLQAFPFLSTFRTAYPVKIKANLFVQSLLAAAVHLLNGWIPYGFRFNIESKARALSHSQVFQSAIILYWGEKHLTIFRFKLAWYRFYSAHFMWKSPPNKNGWHWSDQPYPTHWFND